jgi:transposase-like protein
MSSQTKVCPACKRDLPLTAFYKSRGRCGECRRAYQKDYHGNMRALSERVAELEETVSRIAAKVA